MTILREAAQQALEALEVATTPLAKDRQEVLVAITALREALAQDQFASDGKEINQEPVAWMNTERNYWIKISRDIESKLKEKNT